MKSLSTFIKESRNQNLIESADVEMPAPMFDYLRSIKSKNPEVVRDAIKSYAKANDISFTRDEISSLRRQFFDLMKKKQLGESVDYNKRPLKVGDSVEVIDYDDAVGKIIKLEGNSATVEIKSGTYAGKSKHETKNLVKI